MPVTSSTDLSPAKKRRESRETATEGDPEKQSQHLSTSLRSHSSSSDTQARFNRTALKPNLRWAIPEWSSEGGTALIVVQFLVTRSEDVTVEMIAPDQLLFRCRGRHREDVNLPRGSIVARHAEQKALQFRQHHHILGRVTEKPRQGSFNSFSQQQQQQLRHQQSSVHGANEDFRQLGESTIELDEDGQLVEKYTGSSELDDFEVVISLFGPATLLDRVPTRCLGHVEARLVPLVPPWDRLTRHSPGELPYLVSYAWELESEGGPSGAASSAAGESNVFTPEDDRFSEVHSMNSSRRRRSSAAAGDVTTHHDDPVSERAHHQQPHDQHQADDHHHHHHKDDGIGWLWSKESLMSIAVASIFFGLEALMEYQQHHHGRHH